MSEAYRTVAGQERYNPAADMNSDGKINQYDARYLVKGMPATSPQISLRLVLRLARTGRVAPGSGLQ